MKLKDPVPQSTYIVEQLKDRFPNLAYLHLIEPIASGDPDFADKSNDFIREIWKPRPLITAGKYVRDTAIKMAETEHELVAFGQAFIANVSFFLLLNV
jgi:NADPH2 dehydrogenase